LAPTLGAAFVDDAAVVAEVGRILPTIVAMFFLVGPLMMISGHFQAIGDARRAAVLTLARTYLFAIPLTLVLPGSMGEIGIWLAGPVSEVLALALTLAVLAHSARRVSLRWGVFTHTRGAPS
jgi:Na+-driven multidrug efflux pump